MLGQVKEDFVVVNNYLTCSALSVLKEIHLDYIKSTMVKLVQNQPMHVGLKGIHHQVPAERSTFHAYSTSAQLERQQDFTNQDMSHFTLEPCE